MLCLSQHHFLLYLLHVLLPCGGQMTFGSRRRLSLIIEPAGLRYNNRQVVNWGCVGSPNHDILSILLESRSDRVSSNNPDMVLAAEDGATHPLSCLRILVHSADLRLSTLETHDSPAPSVATRGRRCLNCRSSGSRFTHTPHRGLFLPTV